MAALLRALLAVLLLCLSVVAGAQDVRPVPALSARVIDQTATLSAEQRSRLDAKLAAFERQKGAQIAVLVVASVQPEAIAAYALRVAEAWKLGRRGVDDGILLLVAKDDSKMRIEVGYGLEGAVNDATAKRIVSETIGPRFRQGDFYGGIDAGVDALIKVIDGEALPPPRSAAKSAASGFDLETLLQLAFVLIFVVGGVLRALFGRFLGAGIVGGVAFVVLLFAGLGGAWLPGGGGASGDW